MSVVCEDYCIVHEYNELVSFVWFRFRLVRYKVRCLGVWGWGTSLRGPDTRTVMYVIDFCSQSLTLTNSVCALDER